MQVLHYEGYGKEYIKKFKTSPDGWAQLTKQLAFHKMFGRPGVCYESAQTRKYQLGRTEVIRSASNESKAFAEAMLDPKQTVRVFSYQIEPDHLKLTNASVECSACHALQARSYAPRPVRRMGCRWPRCRPPSVRAQEDVEGRRTHTGDLHGCLVLPYEPLGNVHV